MKKYNPRIKNSELMRCMLALCLSEKNSYRRAYKTISLSDKKELLSFIEDKTKKNFKESKSNEIKLIFDIALNTLSDTVLIPKKTHINRETITKLVNRTKLFREKIIQLHPDSELTLLEDITEDDFDPELIKNKDREEHLFYFAEKIGFCKRYKSTGSFIINKKKPILDRMSAIEAVDQEKNTANKPGCGFSLDHELGHKLFKKYQGVYALYYPSSFNGTEHKGYFMACLRVSHILEKDQSVVARIKLNIPNTEHQEARYQYRGYLSPIGSKDHLNLTLHLATNTINREEQLPDTPPLEPDTVNIICTKMAGMDTIFRGIISSLSQRKPGYSRLPYAANVLLKKQIYQGSEKDVYKAEREFMQKTGLGYFNSLASLADYISDRPESDTVKHYFHSATDKNSMIISEPVQ